MAHRVIARRCSNLVAFGAKRTFSTPRLQYRIYEYAAYVSATRIGADEEEFGDGIIGEAAST